MIADIMTKALARVKHVYFSIAMGLRVMPSGESIEAGKLKMASSSD